MTDGRPLLLVVDDEPINLRVMVEALRDDYRLRVANDGGEALRLAAGEAPDLILLDVMMPGLDGYEVCRLLKEDAATRDIPVIFVTTLGDGESEARGLDLGAVDYITKPVNFRTLQARVRTHLKLRDAQRRLATLSRIDEVTGIPNRRSFEQALDTEWRRNQRDETPLALVLCDIDHFKQYNDRHGHLAGDECLRAVAAAITGAMRRPADMATRYGGEEFAALLTGTDREGARRVAEAIRSNVAAAAGARCAGIAEHVTISCGVAALVPSTAASPTDLVARADAKLYEAKAKGRNRVEV